MTLQSLLQQIEASEMVQYAVNRLAGELCRVMGAERITYYEVDRDGTTLVALVRRGLEGFHAIKLPIDESSLAGYVALHRRVLNVEDVRDRDALEAMDPPARWLDTMDAHSGFTTREMLAAPVVSAASGKVRGVLQLLNRSEGGRFPESSEADLLASCESIARALDAQAARRAQEEARAAEELVALQKELEEDQRRWATRQGQVP